MVHAIERTIVHNCMFMARYRNAVRPLGMKWSLIMLGAMIGFHALAWATGVPELSWISRAIIGFMIFSWIYDYMYDRVMRGTAGRDSWR